MPLLSKHTPFSALVKVAACELMSEATAVSASVSSFSSLSAHLITRSSG